MGMCRRYDLRKSQYDLGWDDHIEDVSWPCTVPDLLRVLV